MYSTTKTIMALGLLAAGSFALTAPAKAEVPFGVTLTDAVVFTGDAPALLDLTPFSNGTAATFTTTSGGRIVIIFNAECTISGNSSSWVNIDILLDPAGSATKLSVPPSNSDNAFCTGHEPAGSLNQWVSASTVATYILPAAGTHSIEVRVSRGFGSGEIRLDDMSLTVMK